MDLIIIVIVIINHEFRITFAKQREIMSAVHFFFFFNLRKPDIRVPWRQGQREAMKNHCLISRKLVPAILAFAGQVELSQV